jgi:SAM-dependent methyltransferase
VKESYHDYVIKEGRFVGAFEEMYNKFDDPWSQSREDSTSDSKSRAATLINIRKYGIGSVVEFGCGLGYFSNLIATETTAQVTGVDIAPTAIRKAREQFPAINFQVDSVDNIAHYRAHDAVLFAEISWYLLPDLNRIFGELLRHFQGKYFMHNLVFYKGDQQKYGRDYFYLSNNSSPTALSNFSTGAWRAPVKSLRPSKRVPYFALRLNASAGGEIRSYKCLYRVRFRRDPSACAGRIPDPAL